MCICVICLTVLCEVDFHSHLTFFLCFLKTVICEVDFYSQLTFFLCFLAFCNSTPYLHWLNISLPVQVRQVSLYFKDKMLLVLHNLCHCCISLGSIFSVDATTGADVMRLGLTKPSQREREKKEIGITFLMYFLILMCLCFKEKHD